MFHHSLDLVPEPVSNSLQPCTNHSHLQQYDQTPVVVTGECLQINDRKIQCLQSHMLYYLLAGYIEPVPVTLFCRQWRV